VEQVSEVTQCVAAFHTGVHVAGARTGVHQESQSVHCLMDAVELVVGTVEIPTLEKVQEVVHVQVMAL